MSSKTIPIVQKILSANDQFAHENKDMLGRKKILAINIMASPGAGKTSLILRTIEKLANRFKIAVIEGDTAPVTIDADKVSKLDIPVTQINTGGECHLDALMVRKGLEQLNLSGLDLLIIENVGNLVCPSSYDLGEDMKVVLISTTEGDDKPSKYPAMFRRSSVMVINKIDLLGMSDFELSKVKENALNINGNLQIIDTSCRTKEGLEEWYKFLEQIIEDKKTILE